MKKIIEGPSCFLHLQGVVRGDETQESPDHQAQEQCEPHDVEVSLSSKKPHLVLHLKCQSARAVLR